MPFSVVILTLNEARNLPGCLASLRGCDDVVVLDSGSTDDTVAIAQRLGARVFTRRFDTFGSQRNYAQREIPFRHDWILHLDADEQATPELLAECTAASGRRDVEGFFIAPRMLWRGRWIPRCTDFPAYQARLARRPEFTFIDVGHGQREATHLRMATLTANYTHDLSSGGVEAWLEKHRRYARIEAAAHWAQPHVPWHDLYAADRLRRRRALKHWSHALPFRATQRFIYQYLLRGGFLDGAAGFEYCRLLARYEGFIACELRRLKAASNQPEA